MKRKYAALLMAALLLLSGVSQTRVNAAQTDGDLLNPRIEQLALTCSVEAEEDGTIYLPEDGSKIDLLLPTSLNGDALYRISDGAFQGMEYFHSVWIPDCITEIGANAFADCSGLEYIILLGRSDSEGMTLGENWSGDAEVIYELVKVEPVPTEPEETEPTEPEAPEETTTPTEPEATEPEATEPEVTKPEATEPEATEPEVTEPEVTEPEATEPEATEPEVTEPEATEPEATEPEVTEPEATEPEVTESEATEPEATEPETTEPEPTEPTDPTNPTE